MAELMLVNPKRRTRRKTTTKRKSPIRRRRRSTALASTKTTVRRYRRNPIRTKGMFESVKNGAVGAAGALAVDVALQKIPFLTNLATGPMAPAVRGGVGIGLGMLVAKFGKNKKLGTQLADGALTVSLYTAGKNALAPTLGLSDDLLGMDDGLLYYGNDDSMGYFDDGDDGMGWNSAAETFDTDEEF